MKVHYTPPAGRDLISILDYIGQDNQLGVLNVRRAIRNTIELIGRFPNVRQPLTDDGIRVLPVGHYPYLVYWTIENEAVWIIRIRDGRRNEWRRD